MRPNSEVYNIGVCTVTRFILVLILLVLNCAGTSFAQTADKPFELPKLDLSLTVEKTLWKSSEPAVVKVIIENKETSKDFLILPSDISFRLAEREIDDVTMSDAVFWSPVSLTKTYEAGRRGCQDNLTNDQVSYSNNSKIRVISPSADKSKLLKNEKKEFTFDLNKLCWGHAISSMYPSQPLFTMIDEYRSSTEKYKVYFQMRFAAGMGVHNGVRYPMSKEMRSNEVEITVNNQERNECRE